MPKEKMVGTQLLVPAALLARVKALAEVRGCSNAEIWRTAVEGSGLRQLERAYADQLRRQVTVTMEYPKEEQ